MFPACTHQSAAVCVAVIPDDFQELVRSWGQVSVHWHEFSFTLTQPHSNGLIPVPESIHEGCDTLQQLKWVVKVVDEGVKH